MACLIASRDFDAKVISSTKTGRMDLDITSNENIDCSIRIGLVLVCSDVDLLIWGNVEHELASCFVLLDVPSSLIWACSGGASLFPIHMLAF